MTVIKVPDMMCENCVKRIRRALEGEGLDFSVSLENKTVTLRDGAAADKALAALADFGFTPERA